MYNVDNLLATVIELIKGNPNVTINHGHSLACLMEDICSASVQPEFEMPIWERVTVSAGYTIPHTVSCHDIDMTLRFLLINCLEIAQGTVTTMMLNEKWHMLLLSKTITFNALSLWCVEHYAEEYVVNSFL